MTTLPEAGIGVEDTPTGLWARARSLVGERLSYALADQVTYSFGNMVVAAMISRHCTSPEFGTYILTQRAMDVLMQLSNVFLWAPFTFNMPAMEQGRARSYMGSIFAQQAVACVLAAIALWAGGLWAAAPEHALYHGVFAPLALTSIGILFREYTRRMYFSHMRFRAAFWTDMATVALQIAGVEWLYFVHRLNVPNTLWALSIGSMLVSLYWLVTEWRSFVVRPGEVGNDMRMNLHLGGWLLGGNMVFMVSSQCNPWVLGSLLGPASVGAYTVCESVVNVPRVALVSLQNTMAPTMARAFNSGGRPALKRVVTRFDRMLLAGSALFAVLIIAAGPEIARLIFKKNVTNDARPILIFLALNFVAFAARMAQSYGLTAIDKPRLVLYANLVGLVAQIAVTVWLVHAFHVPGAAAALLIASIVVLVVRQIFYSREMAST